MAYSSNSYFAGQLDFTTSPLVISVFIQLHPLYQPLGELSNLLGFPFPTSGLGKGKKKERKSQISQVEPYQVSAIQDTVLNKVKTDRSRNRHPRKSTGFSRINELLFAHIFLSIQTCPGENSYQLRHCLH